jgi:hypothetical protein
VNAHFTCNERASDVSGHVLAVSLKSLHTEEPTAPLLTAPKPSVVPEHDIDSILGVVLQVLWLQVDELIRACVWVAKDYRR